MKKQKKKEEVQSRKPAVCDFNFVYVGNVSMPQLRTLTVASDQFISQYVQLQSTITTSILEGFFKDCGQINRTIIRCSRGQAVIAGLAVPQEVLGPRDRQYASIEFTNPQSARKALAYHGMVLDGSKLVVCDTSTLWLKRSSPTSRCLLLQLTFLKSRI